MNHYKHVGKSQIRSDGLEKVTGRAHFVTDMKTADMLYGKIVRSTCAHARIGRIDTEAALKLPGVRVVLTGADIKGRYNNYGVAILDQSIVAVDKVRYVGDPVAAVAATDPFIAGEAASLINVEYEELKGIFGIEDALAPDAVLVHDAVPVLPAVQHLFSPVQGTNICNHFKLRHGDVEEGFRQSDFVFEDTFSTQPVQHAVLETHGCIARVSPGPRIEVVTNNQDPSNLHAMLSHVFKLPHSSIDIVIPYVGGGFGAKIGPKLEPLTVALAWKAGRPVKITLAREEEFLTISRHATTTHVKTGVKKDGTLMAREMTIYLDSGAYADSGPVVGKNLGFVAAGPYRIPHVKIDTYTMYTNKVPAGAMRGFGVPQMAWAYEQQMDIIAERLGMDPLALRKLNVLKNGDMFYTGQTVEATGFDQLLEKAAPPTGWKHEGSADAHAVRSRGKGLSVCLKSTATPSTSTAYVKMHADGSVNLLCNTVEMGQGCRTVFTQMISEELGVPPERITVLDPDLRVSGFDTGTFSSRGTFHMGNAVILASRDLKRQLLDAAAALLRTEKTDLVLDEGGIRVRGSTEKFVPLAQAVRGPAVPRGSLTGGGVFQTKGGFDKENGQGAVSFYWMSAAGRAEVEVDRETGSVKVTRYVGVVDVGQAINPAGIVQQNIGSIMMALGQTFTERMIYNDKGVVLNPDFLDYKIPTVKDLPDEMIIEFLEAPHPDGPYGAKGIGEIMIVPTAAAVANALYQATGIRFKTLPITPEAVLSRIREREGAGKG